MTTDNEARSIFKVLDNENNGFITVKKFISAFHDFYKDCNNENYDENTLQSLIDQMHPDADGKIYFENFYVVFNHLEIGKNSEPKSKKHEKYSIRRFLSAEVDDSSNEDNSDIDQEIKVSDNLNGVIQSHDIQGPQSRSIYSEYKLPKISPNSEFETKGSHSTWPMRRLSLNVNPLLLPSAVSRGRELLSAGASPRESEVHSEILCHEIGNNFEFLQIQMKRLEEKIESFHSNQNDVDGKQSKRLKEENSLLTRRINNLEDNLRELEERANNRLSEEKKDIKLRFIRSEEEKKHELDTLYNRIVKFEADLADLGLEVRQYKDESEKLKAEKHLLTDMLTESDTKLNVLQEKFENFKNQNKLNVENIKKERDDYDKIIVEINERKNKASIEVHNQDICELNNRHNDLENLVDKIKDENKQLSTQIEDIRKDLYQRAMRDGEELLKMNDDLHKELEHFTKEELMDILVKEKDANFKLKDYIENIIVKVMERHPSLLEVAGTAK